MGSMLRCICRHCCDRNDDDDVDEDAMMEYDHEGYPLQTPGSSAVEAATRAVAVGSRRMNRQQLGAYHIAPTGSQDEADVDFAVEADDDDESEDHRNRSPRSGGGGELGELLGCCHPVAAALVRRTSSSSRRTSDVITVPPEHESSHAEAVAANAQMMSVGGASSSSQQAQQQAPLSLSEFFRHLREKWRSYDSVRETDHTVITVAEGDDDDGEVDNDYHMRHLRLRRKNSSGGAGTFETPLKEALTFDSSKGGIPSITPDTIVMPGSDLQKQMALIALAANDLKRIDDGEDECVICMEGFEPTNPRMPTLCGCGENKTYFHLPCLYQWIEQDENCPSCRQKLRWEEF